MPKSADTKIARPLTVRETRWARTVFGGALDYSRVLIHNSKAYFFQPSGTAITPNGQVYFAKADYLSDFGTRVSNMVWLIHELTHVWQSQRGMWVRLRGMTNRTYTYGDLFKSKLALNDFGIEQQAAIVEDYFRTTHGLKPRNGAGTIGDYVRTIPFLPGRTA